MRFYKEQHPYYCGIDLHAKKMYLCIVDSVGNIVLHQNIDTDEKKFLSLIAPYRTGIVVGVECMFCWYWVADLCREEEIPFVLGHALYMKAHHGGKAQNDKIDSEKIAMLLKSGMFPQSYVYPREMRATRDLMRRRLFFVNKRAELVSHIQMTHQQYNVNNPGCRIRYKCNRIGLPDAFEDASVRQRIESDVHMLDYYSTEIGKLESHIKGATKRHTTNRHLFTLLKTIPGVGDVLGLTLLYEIHDISRFPTVQTFSSYSRLVKPRKTSMGKSKGGGGAKIGNRHLKWAFSEAAVLMQKNCDGAQKFLARAQRKYSKAKSISMLAHKLGRTVYFMLEKKQAFNEEKFLKI